MDRVLCPFAGLFCKFHREIESAEKLMSDPSRFYMCVLCLLGWFLTLYRERR